ncbi:hypothetical protein PAMC26577_32600 [Caballeronia sordidicola]|uniref:Uncharacterized protein n=1 Tax=Caballeronia sordidicola TaxID=196367 RepID=A0A242MC34_CABSO|nr:hypothetical protein PAMC26577_32600 [Caballeronia sordidicola]
MPISSIAESAVNEIVSLRCAKKVSGSARPFPHADYSKA